MILLDPDLDPDPQPRAQLRGTPRLASQAAVTTKSEASRRIPSARVLARFVTQAQDAIRLRGRVSVLLTTDKAIRRLNRDFRGIDKPTDVLSFPADAAFPGKEKIAGDLAISVPTARRQGTACGHSLVIELKILILHGLLHLAGYDHETDSGQMARKEQALRAKFGLPLGLIERAQGISSTNVRRKTAAKSRRGVRR
jgi:probable rRNA maturation factor